MCNVSKQLARFWDIVERGNIRGDFRSVCLEKGLCPADVEEALQEELGMSGDEFVSLWGKRVSFP